MAGSTTRGYPSRAARDARFERANSRYGGAAGYAMEIEGKKRAQPGIYCYSSLDEMFATLRSGRWRGAGSRTPSGLLTSRTTRYRQAPETSAAVS